MHTLLWNVTFLLALAHFMSHVSSQGSSPTIQLKIYNQSNSVTTCSEGLRENIDNYIFQSDVSFQGASSEWSHTVIFEVSLQNNSQFTFLCQVDVDNGCAVSTINVCYCTSFSNNVYNIVINKTATKPYSSVPIRGYLLNSSLYQLESEIRRIPPIYASSSRQLTVNGKALPSCQFSITLSNPQVTLCCYNSVEVCFVKILLNGTLVSSNNTCTTYTVNTSQVETTLDFTFKHTVCGGADESNVYTCQNTIEIITTESTTTTLEPTIPTIGTNYTNSGVSTASPSTTTDTKSRYDPATSQLECKEWAIALSVIFYTAILVILGTGITLIVFTLTGKKYGVLFKVCIGILLFDELLDIALIIAFSQTKPCFNDPGSGSNHLTMWQIMLIVFLVSNGVLGVAAAVVAIQHLLSSNKPNPKKTDDETAETVPRPLPIARSGDGDNKQKSFSNGANGKEKGIDSVEMSEVNKTTNKQLTNEYTADQVGNEVKTVKTKKKKKKKLKAKNNDFEKGLSPSQPSPHDYVLHSQAPSNTKLRPVSIEITSNPYVH